jgi:hypothetical protein
MKLIAATLFTSLLAASLPAAAPLYTQTGTDMSFADVVKRCGIKPGTRFAKLTVLGSRIDVNHERLAQQTGKAGPIPKDIGLHTEVSGGITRKEFDHWTRWYQESGNVQVFRLFQGEQNIRSGEEEAGSPGRVEVFTPTLAVAPGAWREWEGTYTIIKPVGANIFQLFHHGKDNGGKPILWPFHIRMNDAGDIYFARRRSLPGLEDHIPLGKNMAGKSLSIKVRANGVAYEVFQKSPLDNGPWKPVTTGTHQKATDGKIQFRWGMYCGSQKGESVKTNALMFVTGVTVR